MRLCEIFLHGIKCGTLLEDDFGIMLATCAFDTIGAITVKTIEA